MLPPRKGSERTQTIAAAALAACIIAAAALAVAVRSAREERPADVGVQPAEHERLAAVQVEARAAYVRDLRSGETLFEKNAGQPLPLASLTKLLSAIVAHEAFPPETIITIPTSPALSDERNGLYAGERWQLDALLRYALVTSSNGAIEAIAEHYTTHPPEGEPQTFVAALNSKAREIGMASSTFFNASGLDVSVEGRTTNAGSAADVAALLAYAMQSIPDILESTRAGERTIASLDAVHEVDNTNQIIDAIPYATASKTGFTDLAGGNLAVAFDLSIGRSVIIIVLGSSREGRFSDMQALVEAARAAVAGA